ncbi:MAG: glyoxylate/hydroxypyruvate reductase A [Alphaproteobacteria bacterium]
MTLVCATLAAMALLFATDFDNPRDWVPALKAELPDLEVRVWPAVGDPADIRYALTWNPQPGLLASLPNLQVIFSLGAGVDGILTDPDLPPALPLVRMVDQSLTEGMTEYVVLHVLDWHRQAAAYRAQQRKSLWRPRLERLARERKVGVMGLGELGRHAALALAALKFDVAGWSRTPKTIDGVTCFHGAGRGFTRFLAASEILVCLLPLTKATAGILGAATFDRLPRGAYLINAARGSHLVETDLLAALGSGQIAGATLDVFGDEPLPRGHPFWRDPRITITPHVASVTHARTAARSVAAQIGRFQADAPLDHLVDRKAEY